MDLFFCTKGFKKWEECDNEDDFDGEFVAVDDVDEPAVDVLDGGVDLELGNDGDGLALTQVLAVEFHTGTTSKQ